MRGGHPGLHTAAVGSQGKQLLLHLLPSPAAPRNCLLGAGTHQPLSLRADGCLQLCNHPEGSCNPVPSCCDKGLPTHNSHCHSVTDRALPPLCLDGSPHQQRALELAHRPAMEQMLGQTHTCVQRAAHENLHHVSPLPGSSCPPVLVHVPEGLQSCARHHMNGPSPSASSSPASLCARPRPVLSVLWKSQILSPNPRSDCHCRPFPESFTAPYAGLFCTVCSSGIHPTQLKRSHRVLVSSSSSIICRTSGSPNP